MNGMTKYDKGIQTPWQLAMRRFRRNRPAMLGLIVLGLVMAFCFLGPMLSPYEILQTNIRNAKKPPSTEHWLGTDAAGRDVLLRLMEGGKISLMVGIFTTLIQVIMGTLIGGVSGYYGGRIDGLLMRFTDICMSLPFMPIALILASVMSDMGIKPQHRIYYLMVIIGMLSWPQLARLIRGQVLTLREREFMLAAEALGISDSRRILRHLLPNVIPLVMVDATLSIGGSILSESAMSFLGLGVAPPYPSWGNMVDVISDLSNLRRPWIWVPPGVMIVLTVMAVYAVGNGLRDALDPKMMRQGS